MSQITLINHTTEVVRLAIFKPSVRNPTLASIAWKVAAPPPGGSQTIEIPAPFEVVARYSANPADPANLSCRTAAVAFAETTARFAINAVTSQDRMTSGAVITQSFEDLVLNEVRIVNNYGIGCEVSLCKAGDAMYAPQVVWPGAQLMEDVRSAMCVAVVAQFTLGGQRLVQEEIGMTQTEVLEGGTVTVTGSMWKGYALTVG
jgi:hypothetical protein